MVALFIHKHIFFFFFFYVANVCLPYLSVILRAAASAFTDCADIDL